MASPFTLNLVLSLVLAGAAGGQTPREPDRLLTKLLRILGLSATSAQMKGPAEDVASGDIWTAQLDGGTGPHRLTSEGGYRSPIVRAGDTRVLALRHEAIVELDTKGAERERTLVQHVNGVRKLVGVDRAVPLEVVVLLEEPIDGSPLATVSLRTGTTTALPFDASSEAERRLLAQIRAQDREYGTTSVYLKTETKPGLFGPIEWTDVFVKRGAASPQNVSRCDGANCTQPSLSPGGGFVAFVKAEE